MHLSPVSEQYSVGKSPSFMCLCHFSPRGDIEDINRTNLLPGDFWDLQRLFFLENIWKIINIKIRKIWMLLLLLYGTRRCSPQWTEWPLHICEDITSVAHICEGIKVHVVLCHMYKNICRPSDKVFFWKRTLWNRSLCSLRQCGFGVWKNVWAFKWPACSPDLSLAEMCGTFGSEQVLDICLSGECFSSFRSKLYKVCLSQNNTWVINTIWTWS